MDNEMTNTQTQGNNPTEGSNPTEGNNPTEGSKPIQGSKPTQGNHTTENKKGKSKKAIIILSIFLALCAIGAIVYFGFIYGRYSMGPLRAELSDGTLTISGKGDMPDFSKSDDVPWYNEREKITNVVIKDGVTSIGDRAFVYCDSLESITIPDSVTSIGEDAFYSCDSLESVTIPDSVTSIGEEAFSECQSLASVTIGDSVNSIGDYAFEDCDSLTSIAVSSGNKMYHSKNNCLIETSTKILVLGCKNSVIPTDGSVTSIGESAFYGCDSLASITIPDGVTSIGDWAFASCDSLTSVTIGDSVTSIGEFAFFGCDSLVSITIGDSVTSIGKYAFYDCDSLASVTFKDPNGWYVTKTESASSGTNVTVTDKSTAADYLTDEYTMYYWYKK